MNPDYLLNKKQTETQIAKLPTKYFFFINNPNLTLINDM